jgi:hypothetical protein
MRRSSRQSSGGQCSRVRRRSAARRRRPAPDQDEGTTLHPSATLTDNAMLDRPGDRQPASLAHVASVEPRLDNRAARRRRPSTRSRTTHQPSDDASSGTLSRLSRRSNAPVSFRGEPRPH